jgi:hypothetical protein
MLKITSIKSHIRSTRPFKIIRLANVMRCQVLIMVNMQIYSRIARILKNSKVNFQSDCGCQICLWQQSPRVTKDNMYQLGCRVHHLQMKSKVRSFIVPFACCTFCILTHSMSLFLWYIGHRQFHCPRLVLHSQHLVQGSWKQRDLQYFLFSHCLSSCNIYLVKTMHRWAHLQMTSQC